jgi:nitrogen fixation protein FixH
MTGRHVFFIVAGFFLVVIAVNAVMITQAIRTFRGEDIKQSYRQGLEYNDTLAKRASQKQSGWVAEIFLDDNHKLTLTLKDASGSIIRGLDVSGIVKHPIETDLDLPVQFKQNEHGEYIAQINGSGKRWLETKAVDSNGFVFETRNEIWLK